MGGTCVLASCMDEILCSLRAQMSAAKTEQDRGCDGSTQASLLLSDKKRKHLLAGGNTCLHQRIHQLKKVFFEKNF